MRFKSNNFNGKRFNPTNTIKTHHTERLAFNFSFLTKDSQYNLDKRGKNVNKTVKLKLIERICALSTEDKVIILGRPKEQGLELLPEREVSFTLNSEFKSSGRLKECDEGYWVFRLSTKGRGIGKINDNIFYLLAIDPKFELYNHGS